MEPHGASSERARAASAKRCLQAIADALGIKLDHLPPKIIAAVTAFGLECGQHVQHAADLATTRPAPPSKESATYALQLDEVTRVGRFRKPRL